MAKKAKMENPADEAARSEEAGEGLSGGAAGAEEAGAPATDEGPSLDDLMPDLGEAVEKADADERALLQARVSTLEAEKAELRDRMLRALADAENTRRRAERDRKDAETYGGTRLARDLLAVHDNLDRALAAADDELREKHGAFLEGVELTRRELLNAFEKHKIAKVEPAKGEKFDPNLHQAMFEAAVPGAANGTVIEVMVPGFRIGERLLRPAMVGVARGGKGAAKPAEPASEASGAAEAATAEGEDSKG